MLPVSDYKINDKKKDLNLAGKIEVKILVFFACAVILLLFTQLVFANNLATDGQKLSEIEEEIQKLNAENTTLKVEIAKESSLNALSKKAKDLSFERPSRVINLQTSSI